MTASRVTVRRKKLPTPASWQKGQSGNPNGAPKKPWRWSEILREAAEKIGKDGREYKVAAAEALLKEALKGNITAIRELGDRLEGRPRQAIEIKPPERQIDLHAAGVFRAKEMLKKRNIDLKLTYEEWESVYKQREAACSET